MITGNIELLTTFKQCGAIIYVATTWDGRLRRLNVTYPTPFYVNRFRMQMVGPNTSAVMAQM